MSGRTAVARCRTAVARSRLLVRVLALGPVVAVALVAAPAEPALAASGPLTAAPDQVSLGAERQATVELTNDTSAKVPLRLSVVGRDGRSVAGAGASGPSEIGPFGRAAVVVTAPDEPVAGLELVVVGGAGEDSQVLRLPVGAAPAVTSWTVRRFQPFGAVDGQDLPLNGPCGYLGVEPGTTLGFVEAEGKSVRISGTCMDASTPSLRLTASDRQWAGRTYTGTVVLGSSGESLDVSFVTTSAWWVVAGLVLVGILIALAVNRWLNGGRAVAELRWRLLGIDQLVHPDNPKNADRLFAEAASQVGLPPAVRAWTVRGAVTARTRDLLRQLRGDFLHRQVDATKVAAAIDDLEMEVRGWPETANLVGLLQSRAGSIIALRRYYDEARERTFGRIGPSELTIDEIKQIRTFAQVVVMLAGDWPGDKIFATAELAKHLDEGTPAWEHWEALRNRFGSVHTVAAAEQAREEFERVDAEVRGTVAAKQRAAAVVQRGSADAGGSASVVAASVVVGTAVAGTGVTGSVIADAVSADISAISRPGGDDAGSRDSAGGTADSESVRGLAADGHGPDNGVADLVGDGQSLVGLAVHKPVIRSLFVRADVATPSAEASGLAHRIALFDQAIMAILLLAVLLAGMKALYIDNTFGGVWDAAIAMSWGLAGGIVSGPLSTALGRAAESVRSLLGR